MCKLLLILLSVLLLASTTVIPRTGPIEAYSPLNFKVQIDDPPLVRWAPIIKAYNHSLNRFVEFLDQVPVPKGFYDGVEYYAKNQFQYQDFVAQIDAVAQLSGIPFEKLMFLNLLYEFTTVKACTGILVRTTDGKILHGRNWDFQMYQLLAKMVSNVEYYRGSKLIYAEDAVAGAAFTLTGIKKGAFGISVNARTHAIGQSGTLVSVLKQNAIPALWLVRKVFIEQQTFAAATYRLKNTRISCPIYFIVSGVRQNEGMVIERNTDNTKAYYELSEDQWFLIQTNYDRDEPQPVYDPRRIPTEKKLQQRGNSNFNEQTLLDEFMFKWPNFNIATIFTDIMVPSTGYKNTTVWYGSNPVVQQMYLQKE